MFIVHTNSDNKRRRRTLAFGGAGLGLHASFTVLSKLDIVDDVCADDELRGRQEDWWMVAGLEEPEPEELVLFPNRHICRFAN